MFNIIWVFFALVILSTFKKRIWLHIGFLMLAYMFSMRSFDIPDTDMYLRDFENPYVDFIQNSLEPGFWSLDVFFGHIFPISFNQFLFVLTLFMMELWYHTTKRLLPDASFGFCFLIFMSYNGFFYLGVTLKNAMSLLISYYAISILASGSGKKRYLFFTLLIIVAFLFHRSALMLLILPFIKMIKLSKAVISIWLIVDLVLIIIGGAVSNLGFSFWASPTGGLDKYEESLITGGSSLISLWFIMNLIITIAIVRWRACVLVDYKKIYDLFFLISMIGFSINCVGWNLGIIQRLAGSFYFFNFIPLYLIIFHSNLLRLNSRRKFVADVASVFCFLVLLYCQSFMIYY